MSPHGGSLPKSAAKNRGNQSYETNRERSGGEEREREFFLSPWVQPCLNIAHTSIFPSYEPVKVGFLSLATRVLSKIPTKGHDGQWVINVSLIL